MQELALEAQAGHARRAQQLLALRFYLRRIIEECQRGWCEQNPVETNFHALLDQISVYGPGPERTIFVTFNYDRLLEMALESEGKTFKSLDDYTAPGNYRLFKLHGSIDWVRHVGERVLAEERGSERQPPEPGQETARLETSIIGRAMSLPLDGQIHPAAVSTTEYGMSQAFIPALAIPLREKSTFECPPTHVTALRHLLPSVRAILTVGWSAGEYHFLNLLQQASMKVAAIQCVTGSDSESREVAHALTYRLHTSRTMMTFRSVRPSAGGSRGSPDTERMRGRR